MSKKKSFINSFNINDKPENILDPEMLQNVKKNYHFNYNEETSKIEISSKFNVPEEDINESV